MGDLQHFCLRWNNYQSSITSAFENLRDDEDFVDVTLACEGKSLKAHRVVLSACSPYFRELLKSTPCKHPVIVLQDVVFEDLHALVEFIYHGEVNVHQRSLSSFLKTAEVLRVSGLTQQAEASSLSGSEKGTGRGEGEERGSHSPSGSQHNRRPPHHRHNRERRLSNEAADANPESALPLKRVKTETSTVVNHLPATDTLTRVGDQQQASASVVGSVDTEAVGGGAGDEPPVDFSAPPPPLKSCSPAPSPLTPDMVKSEPLDHLITHHDNQDDDSDDDSGDNGGGSEAGRSADLDDSQNPHHHNSYLDSKLFGASFNFSMAAALAADSLAGLNNQSHSVGGGADGLASTSSQELSDTEGRGWGRLCRVCGKCFSRRWSLRRHMTDTHFSTRERFPCARCGRTYRSRNSLVSHYYQYHAPRKLPPAAS